MPRLPIRWLLLMVAAGSSEVLLAAAPQRPIVAGFERIHAGDKPDAVAGGRLLLTELNCVSCHAVDDELARQLRPKQAPVLSEVGSRVQVSWLKKYLSDAHSSKPGTTMPNLFAASDAALRDQQVESLVHLLASTGRAPEAMSDSSAVKRGEALFHSIGCAACHAPQREGLTSPATSVPLGAVHEKYTLPSLITFLKNPLAVRPSGRMPNLKLNDEQSRDIASFFLRDVKIATNMNFAYYEGSWNELPDYSTLTPVASGLSSGFDLGVSPRKDNFAVRFQGFIHLPREGDYRFWLGSDDGSRLLIDGKEVVDVNGIHPHTVKDAAVKLTQGVHAVEVQYFEQGGEETLTVEFQGPQQPRQPLASIATVTEAPPKRPDGEGVFVVNGDLATAGRDVFAAVGCANCHELKVGNTHIVPTLKAKKLTELSTLTGGCLSPAPVKGLPAYQLSETQTQQIAAALTSLRDVPAAPSPQTQIHHTLAQFNCYACHGRNELGGVEPARDTLFTGTMPEMGDEGRLPPTLDGVGDKLTDHWMKNILDNGAKDRPYMFVMMPQFGGNNVGHLRDAFRDADLRTEAVIPESEIPETKLKAAGRHLVGEKALSCIKCHKFDQHKATGIQAIDLTTMATRLRSDWFYRYMIRPQTYRSGTRMPAPWPFGQTSIRDVLDANAPLQLHAVWLYLTDGNKAGIPEGVNQGAIVLAATDEPVIYRNFIEGVSPRAIAVGYPEKVNLCFDAQNGSLALLWENQFIDASLHWNGRGPGFQRPLGDNVLSLVRGVPLAVLESPDVSWPGDDPAKPGYHFNGYRYNEARQPTFLYSVGDVTVADESLPAPRSTAGLASFRRSLSLSVSHGDAPATLWFRAADGASIEQSDGVFLIDGHLRIQAGASVEAPVVRQSGNRKELLIPVKFADSKAKIALTYEW